MQASEQEWERLLGIKTSGRDDSHSDGEHHPYEPTDYCVLERLANSGLIRKKNTLIDYGSGKGRVGIFLSYQTGCHSIGIEYDERLWQKAMVNAQSTAARQRGSASPSSSPMRRLMSFLMKRTAAFSSIPLPCTR